MLKSLQLIHVKLGKLFIKSPELFELGGFIVPHRTAPAKIVGTRDKFNFALQCWIVCSIKKCLKDTLMGAGNWSEDVAM